MITEEDEYYLRASILLLKGGRLMSQETLNEKVRKAGEDLDVLLKQHKRKFKHKLVKEQRSKLFPDAGVTDVETWDLAMLTTVLLTVFKHSLNDDEKNDLKSIKCMRDEIYAHTYSSSLNADQYEEIRKELENALTSLSKRLSEKLKDSCSKIIQECTTGPISPSLIAELTKQIEDTEPSLQAVMNKLRSQKEFLLEMKKEDEDKYFLRASILLLKGGRLMSKETLYKELRKAGEDLDVLLKQHKRKFKHKFVKKQMDKLFPDAGGTDVETWDLAMLTTVLLTVFKQSLNEDEKNDLKSIKCMGDEIYAHTYSSSLNADQYEDIRKELENALTSLSKELSEKLTDDCSKIIQECTTDPISPSLIAELTKQIEDTEHSVQAVTNKLRNKKELLCETKKEKIPEIIISGVSDLLDMTAINGLEKGERRLVEECQNICDYIKRKSDDILNVWPAIDCDDNDNIVFVCDISKQTKLDIDTGYNYVPRYLNQYSREDTEVMQHSLYKSKKLTSDESERLSCIINKYAETLMGKHKYLSVITASAVRSEHYGKANREIKPETCIIMYVDSVKGKIPLGEDRFPEDLDGVTVDVREGGFCTAVNITADGVHETLRMGCKISAVQDQYGTLGGFIDHPEYGLCGFSCAHVLVDENTLSTLTMTKKMQWNERWKQVYQPIQSEDGQIGRLLECYYDNGHGYHGVDLALFSIDKRPPVSGEFPWFENKLTGHHACENFANILIYHMYEQRQVGSWQLTIAAVTAVKHCTWMKCQ
ncbi:uncharacterized protein LOC128553847 isoform X2 [Mercenaria mercenaria]|uniref:uncharacterized protein LOC128553847 isoform X2 n=1 Tax=Mercenaria mercenaria TaxID=6596 RepID=UPI00234E8C31|nr:uncharacterized protein LOC128553847 isoform X2 [Mercenaria mercenaria]